MAETKTTNKGVEAVVDAAIENANEKPHDLASLAAWVRRKIGASVVSTVAHSENNLGGEFERIAAYGQAARNGANEEELTTYVRTGINLRQRNGVSGSSDETTTNSW